MLKRIIWKFNFIMFYFKARGLTLINVNREGCMRSMQQQLGTLGTKSEFACRQKKTKKTCSEMVGPLETELTFSSCLTENTSPLLYKHQSFNAFQKHQQSRVLKRVVRTILKPINCKILNFLMVVNIVPTWILRVKHAFSCN